jgi:Flp pilus assembly protein TadG
VFARNRRRNRRRSRLGIEIAELAFALPIMTTLVFGTLELCELLFLKQSLAVASYEAGRLAARSDTTTTDVTTRFEQIMASRRVTGATIQLTPSNLATAARGDHVRIDVTAPVVGNSSTHLVISSVPPIRESTVFVRE